MSNTGMMDQTVKGMQDILGLSMLPCASCLFVFLKVLVKLDAWCTYVSQFGNQILLSLLNEQEMEEQEA